MGGLSASDLLNFSNDVSSAGVGQGTYLAFGGDGSTAPVIIPYTSQESNTSLQGDQVSAILAGGDSNPVSIPIGGLSFSDLSSSTGFGDVTPPDLSGAAPSTDWTDLFSLGVTALPPPPAALVGSAQTTVNPVGKTASTSASPVTQALGLTGVAANTASQLIAAANGSPNTLSRVLGTAGTAASIIAAGKTPAAASTTSVSTILLYAALGILILVLVLRFAVK